MNTTKIPPFVPALGALSTAIILMIALLQIGPDHLTVTTNSDWKFLYLAPAALAVLTGATSAVTGSLLRSRSGRSQYGLWIAAGLSLPVGLILFLYGILSLMMASIGVEDGGWVKH